MQWITAQALNGYINPIFVTGSDRRGKALNDYSDHLYDAYLTGGGVNPTRNYDGYNYDYDLYRRRPSANGVYDYRYRSLPDAGYYDGYRGYRSDYRSTYPSYVQDVGYASSSVQPPMDSRNNQPVINIPAARSTTMGTPTHN